MLSSLGARRDRSSSPSEGRPPSKVFIQDDGKSVSQQRHSSSVPKIVVQECSKETMLSSPPSSARSPMKEGIAVARGGGGEQLKCAVQEQQWHYEDQQMFQKQSETNTQVEKPEDCEQPSSQAAVKLPLSPQELQSRKAKAVKNRPWLQKPASGEPKPEVTQQKQVKLGQITSEKHQKEHMKKEQEPQVVRGLPGPSAESTIPPKNRSINKAAAQISPQTAGQEPGTSPEAASSPTDAQLTAKTVSQSGASPGPSQTRVQTYVPAEAQLCTSPQALVPEAAIAHAQIWARVRPSSPMQASLHGHVQPPVPAPIQLFTHPQSWAPVRPPHPRSPTQPTVQPESISQPQGQHSDPFPQTQTHSMSLPQPFYPPGYFQGQSSTQPWMPFSQPYPQQGSSTGSVPSKWPQLGLQEAALGFSVDLSNTQACMQTEAEVALWDSLNQMKGSGLVHVQGQKPSSQFPPQAFPHPQMLFQPQTQQPSQKGRLTPPQPQTQLHIHSSEPPEEIEVPAQLPSQAQIQSPVQSVVMKPQPVTELSFPSKAELSQPKQLVQTVAVPQPQVPSPPHTGHAKEDCCDRTAVQGKRAPSPPKHQSLTQHQGQSPGQPTQPEPAGPLATLVEAQSALQPRPGGQTALSPPQTQASVSPQPLSESPDPCVSPLTLSQAPPQAYTEAYTKAQALARNGFEEAKHCLQEHIRETISIFEDKSLSAEQASLKEVNISFVHSSLYKPRKGGDVRSLSYFRSRSQILFKLVAALATEQTAKSQSVSMNFEQISPGDSQNTGPRVTRGVFEGSQRHGGLLFAITAQRPGLLHPVCQNAVGGKLSLLSR